MNMKILIPAVILVVGVLVFGFFGSKESGFRDVAKKRDFYALRGRLCAAGRLLPAVGVGPRPTGAPCVLPAVFSLCVYAPESMPSDNVTASYSLHQCTLQQPSCLRAFAPGCIHPP